MYARVESLLRLTVVTAGLAIIADAALSPYAATASEDAAKPGNAVGPSVPVGIGETCLTDVGIYRVCWQSYGGDPVQMPLGWAGHFEPRAGISYQNWGRVLDRRALLMHSPWHVPPGKTWVDYPLTLPPEVPIQLSFGIAIGPDVASPDKSDGVTFSCYLIADHAEQELMRTHQAKGQWLDYQFDLSAHAGQRVIVRLQVEPGPANNASFDYSFFGDPKLTVGKQRPPRSQSLDRLTSSRAYRATADADLTRLSNERHHGVAPSNHLPHRNEMAQSGDVWSFAYDGEDCRVVYTYRPATGTLDDFVAQVDGGPPFLPMAGGGAFAPVQKQGASQEVSLHGGKALDIARSNDALNVLWQYDLEGQPIEVAWQYRIVGKSLCVGARCEKPLVSRFSLGSLGPVPIRRTISVPFLLGSVLHLPVENVFVNRYLDWTVSHASECPQGVATYNPKTDKSRNAMVEQGFVAVSPAFGEVLPNIPHPPSPHLASLGPRIMLDIWGHHQGTYQGDAENLRALKDHGVDHVAIIQHVWQRFGYDVKLPDHMPANPQFGGDEGMIAFGKAANECGYLWSVHENYIDLYPDAPSYDPAARVLNADGTPSKAWYNAGTKVQSYGLKCNRALGYAKQNAPEIHRRFATTAAYLDVHTCVPPWHQLDHEAGQPMAAMALGKMKFDRELFQYMRDTHGGPLFGEGNNQFYWAGLCDGVEAQVNGGEDHQPLLDFDLLKLHPQMVNHGMGYYERWFRRGYDHRFGFDTGTMEQIDKYRAQELAYGHAGFVGAAQVDNLQWVVREHHLMHPVQRLYGTSKPVEIRYEVDGRLVSTSAALAVGDTSRQRIRYASGLTLWINWRQQPWQVEGHVLPAWGFLALGPETKVWTALVGDKVADYAECPQYVFADARTSFSMPYLQSRKNIEPRLRSFKYLGDDRAEVTYEWIVNDTLDKKYTCFVHGVDIGADQQDRIEFQQDHGLSKPTDQWRPGDVIVDGPHEMRVSPKLDRYDLVVGLYRAGDGRVPLKGIRQAGDRIVIGQLDVQRADGKIVNVAARPPQARNDSASPEADFTVRLNPAGTWIDFDKVATDGSVKVNRQKDQLVLFPYPREKPFRVSLDLKALAPDADPARIQVRALAAKTKQDLGPVKPQLNGGRLTLDVGTPGAGRYVVTWN